MTESATTVGLATKVTTLEKSIWELKLKAASMEVVNKLDNKLDTVIRANDLKKRSGWHRPYIVPTCDYIKMCDSDHAMVESVKMCDSYSVNKKVVKFGALIMAQSD